MEFNSGALVILFFGCVLTLAGVIMKIWPPKSINALYGYRTNRSMKNQEKWDLAQRMASHESIKIGALVILTSFWINYIDESAGSAAVIVVILAACAILIFNVEKRLK